MAVSPRQLFAVLNLQRPSGKASTSWLCKTSLQNNGMLSTSVIRCAGFCYRLMAVLVQQLLTVQNRGSLNTTVFFRANNGRVSTTVICCARFHCRIMAVFTQHYFIVQDFATEKNCSVNTKIIGCATCHNRIMALFAQQLSPCGTSLQNNGSVVTTIVTVQDSTTE